MRVPRVQVQFSNNEDAVLNYETMVRNGRREPSMTVPGSTRQIRALVVYFMLPPADAGSSACSIRVLGVTAP